MTLQKFQRFILNHYRDHGRKNLPWKKTRDPYRILVSEVMLQQTQVSRVLPKYTEFLNAFPSVKSLAKAPDAKLLKVWQGLGYWRRAKYLQAAAQKIVKDLSLSLLFGVRRKRAAGLPAEASAKAGPGTLLEALPGVGPYTARAVACFAFGDCEPFIDTNIRRVYLHFFFPNQKSVSDESIRKIAQRALYKKDPRIWHYALIDYGATVLKDKKINRRSRHYAKQSQFEGSFRALRSSVVQLLLAQPGHAISRRKLDHFLQEKIHNQNMSYAPAQVVSALTKDNLIKQSSKIYHL